MKIVVTGAKGQLGSEIKFLSDGYDFEFVFIDKEELDLSKVHDIVPFLAGVSPDFIINCAAYTAVDQAEDDEELAHIINAEVPHELAKYCKESGCRLLHISTDYVFDGQSSAPISETEKPNPQSAYGRTKLAGEKAVTGILNDAYIIRTAWVYSSFGNNFVKTMLRLGKEKDELNVVSDQFGSPTYARDLAEALLKIIDQITQGNDQPGVYHFSNEGEISWFDFASEIMKLGELDCKVNPIPTSEFPTKAERPKYSVLDKTKIKDMFKLQPKEWKASLIDMINLLK